MKKLLIPIFAVLFFSCGQQARSPEHNENTEQYTDTGMAKKPENTTKPLIDSPDKANDPIVFIRKKVEHINTVQNKKKHFEFMCDEQMKVDYFYDNDKIVKISVDFGTVGDVYAKEDYYYHNNHLIFKYEFVEGGPACKGCIKKDEYRSYIKDNRVIRYLKNKTATTCRKCAFETTLKEYKLLQAASAEKIKAILCR